MISHPHPLLTAGEGSSVGGASRINTAGGTPGNLARRCQCVPLSRLMVSIKLRQVRGRADEHAQQRKIRVKRGVPV
jgi:hypothetical protein